MAKLKKPLAKLKPPEAISRLLEAIRRGLATVGIDARTDVERIQGTGLYRVYVVGKKLGALRPSERQDLVWRIAGQVLTPDEQLRISMILTLTPEEMGWVQERLQ